MKQLGLQPVDVLSHLNRITSHWHWDRHWRVDSLSQLADSLIEPGIDLISLTQVSAGFAEYILQTRLFVNELLNLHLLL